MRFRGNTRLKDAPLPLRLSTQRLFPYTAQIHSRQRGYGCTLSREWRLEFDVCPTCWHSLASLRVLVINSHCAQEILVQGQTRTMRLGSLIGPLFLVVATTDGEYHKSSTYARALAAKSRNQGRVSARAKIVLSTREVCVLLSRLRVPLVEAVAKWSRLFSYGVWYRHVFRIDQCGWEEELHTRAIVLLAELWHRR